LLRHFSPGCLPPFTATYAAVRISAVKNWPRLGTNRVADELDEVAKGEFPFDDHEHLLIAPTDEVLGQTKGKSKSGSEGIDDEE
jgi:hypothetical protein